MGAYSHEDYTPSLPILLVSVPMVNIATQLPPSVSAVLQRCYEMGLLATPTSLDFYLIAHSALIRHPCEHFNCFRDDEFSVMYQAWTFDVDNMGDSHGEITAAVHMGLFEPRGVVPCHQEFNDAGMAFGRLSLRSVIMHGRRFSPNNANIRLQGTTAAPTFISVAVDRVLRKGVVSVHLLPTNDDISDKVRAATRRCMTLRSALEGLAEAGFTDFHAHAMRALAPLQ